MSGVGESDAGVGWADVATTDDLRSLDNALRAEIAELRTETRSGLADVRTEVRTGLADVRTEIADVRTEIAEVRVEMHDSMRRLALTLVGAMVSISGITFAANALV